jgi:hypothetical protein
VDILDEIRFHMQVATDARRTLICEPDRLASVEAAVDQLGAGDIFTVKPSPVCPVGKLLVLDEQALEASWQQTIQRAGHDLRVNGLRGGPTGSR